MAKAAQKQNAPEIPNDYIFKDQFCSGEYLLWLKLHRSSDLPACISNEISTHILSKLVYFYYTAYQNPTAYFYVQT